MRTHLPLSGMSGCLNAVRGAVVRHDGAVSPVGDVERYLQWRFRYMPWRTGVALVLFGFAAPVGLVASAAREDWSSAAWSLGVLGCAIALLAWPAVAHRLRSGPEDSGDRVGHKRRPPWVTS